MQVATRYHGASIDVAALEHEFLQAIFAVDREDYILWMLTDEEIRMRIMGWRKMRTVVNIHRPSIQYPLRLLPVLY